MHSHTTSDGGPCRTGRTRRPRKMLDDDVLNEPITEIATRNLLVHSPDTVVSVALKSMQEQHSGSVIITRDGTPGTHVEGIFTERDVLHRVIDCAGDLSLISLSEVMTPDPVVLSKDSTIAWMLNRMSVVGVRNVPIVDDDGCPLFVVAIRDIVDLLVEAYPKAVLNLPLDEDHSYRRHREGA